MAGPNARPELKLIYNLPICDWQGVGLELGISGNQIKVIERNNVGDENARKREMFSQWLRQDANATYAKLADVLQTHEPPEAESVTKLESKTGLHFPGAGTSAGSAPVANQKSTPGPTDTQQPITAPQKPTESTPGPTDTQQPITAPQKPTGPTDTQQPITAPQKPTELTSGPPPPPSDASPSTPNITEECSVMEMSEDYCVVSSDGGSTKLKAYKMKSPHGIALVISNIKFNSGTDLDDRTGADADEKNLSKLFNLLGYKFVLLQNLTGQEIDMALQVVSGYEGMTFEKLDKKSKEHLITLSVGDNLIQDYHDSFVCCLLSHGTTGQIYGIDQVTFDLKDIYEYLGSCKHLSGKPKMVFIQACQGQQIAHPDGADPPPIVQSDGGNSMYTTQSKDFLMSYAAFYGQKCFRWTEGGKGSWYIKALCRIFEEEHKEKDVVSMITEVHSEVMGENAKTSEGEQYCQCPRLEHTLRYKVQLAVKGGWLW